MQFEPPGAGGESSPQNHWNASCQETEQLTLEKKEGPFRPQVCVCVMTVLASTLERASRPCTWSIVAVVVVFAINLCDYPLDERSNRTTTGCT